jgi:MFS family permease
VFEHDQLWFYVVFGLLQGIGNGFYFAATPNLIIEAVPEHLTGVSGGMVSLTSALAGGVMPVVISVILLRNILHVDPATHAVAFGSAGYSYALVVIAACAAVALVLTAFMRHGRTPATGGAVSGH